MRLALVTGPVSEPVSVAEAKEQARVEHELESALWSRWIQAAREEAESTLDRALLPQTWILTLDEFRDIIELPRPPAVSATIAYRDGSGEWQDLDEELYDVDVDGEPGRITPVSSWPATGDYYGAVKVTFVAGYADAAAVPARIKHAICWLASWWNEHREAEGQAPEAFANLLAGSFWGEL